VQVPVMMTVANPPVCSFNTSSPDDLGQITSFTNTTTGDDPISYRWNFGDGSSVSAATSPTHQYAQVGLYTVVLTATNTEGQDVCSNQVSIESTPIPSFTSSGPTMLYKVTTFTNTTLANPPVTFWQWDFGDPASGVDNFSTAESPTHTFSAERIYTVTLIALNPKGPAQYQGTVTVYRPKVYLPLVRK